MIKIMAKSTINDLEPYVFEVEKGLKSKTEAYKLLEENLLLGVLQMMTPGMKCSFDKGIDKVTVTINFTNGEKSHAEYYLEEY